MSVKPPGGPGAAPPVPPEAPEGKAPTVGEPFSSHLEGAPSVSGATSDLAAELVAQVRDGSITVDEAVEALVERTLSNPAFASLSAERREALREELREIVASDPVLCNLVAQMGR